MISPLCLRARAIRVLTVLIIASLPAWKSIQAASIERWYSPNGTGSGNSSTSPKAYSLGDLQALVQGSGPADDISVRFLPGVYVTQPITFSNPSPTQRRLRLSGEGSNRGATVIKLADGAAGAIGATSYQFVFWMNSYVANDYLDRLVITNVTFDCNWAGQGAAASPANVQSYKNSGISALAKTGLIRNVAVVNFGSVGMVPVPWSNPAGAEAFPILVSTRDVGQPPESGFDHPWVIEDCEVTGFTGIHGGYCTAIHSDVTRDVNLPGTTPLIVVRRCQVRGGIPIAYGVTGGKVRIQDCVALDAGLGINNDTGQYRYCIYTNNLFLDVFSAANFGGHGWPVDSWKDFNVSQNAIRLRGVNSGPDYRNYYTPVTPMNSSPVSQASLILGRTIIYPSIGFTLPGAETDIVMNGNRFTTWPRSQFNLPSPNDLAGAQFRAIWPMYNGDYVPDVVPNYSRSPQKNIGFTNNVISDTAFDFGNLTPIPTETIVTYNPNDGLDEAAQHKALRNATSTLPYAFTPGTTVGRASLILDGSNRLLGLREVALATPTMNGLSISLMARLAEQKTPLASGIGTVRVSGQPIRFTVTSGPNAGAQGVVVSDSYGTATFTYSANGFPGEDVIVAYLDESGGTPGQWDPDQDSYSTVRQAIGAVVTVKADPDVAKDRPVVRAPFKFRRTGSITNAQTVKFTLPTTGTGIHRPAAYGSTLDYTLNPLNGATLSLANANGTGVHTFTIPAGLAEAGLEVVPRADDKLETEVVYLRIETDPAYGVGSASSANILIYDGPKYNVIELVNYGTTQASAAYAVNGVSGTPRVAGQLTVPTGGTPAYNQAAGFWTMPAGYNFTAIDGVYLTYPGNAVSIGYGISDTDRLVGIRGGRAFRFEAATGYSLLASLYTGGANEAHAISPNGITVVGNGILSAGGPARAVRWRSTDTPAWGATELGTFGGTFSYALGVNNAGHVVGQAATAAGAGRAFRTTSTVSGGVELGLQPYDAWRLYGNPPPPLDTSLHTSAAHAVASTGAAVGQAAKAYPQYTGAWVPVGWTVVNRACFWWWWPDTSGGSIYTPMYLGVMNSDQYPWSVRDSAAMAINDLGNNVHEIVGWSHTTASTTANGTPRAFYAVVAPWSESGRIPLIGLNDEHLLHNAPGWILTSAEGINNSGVIVGNGTLNGLSRGFALIPITP